VDRVLALQTLSGGIEDDTNNPSAAISMNCSGASINRECSANSTSCSPENMEW